MVGHCRELKPKRAAEMLIKHHLSILRELATEFALKLSLIFLPLERNKVGILTRMKKT